MDRVLGGRLVTSSVVPMQAIPVSLSFSANHSIAHARTVTIANAGIAYCNAMGMMFAFFGS